MSQSEIALRKIKQRNSNNIYEKNKKNNSAKVIPTKQACYISYDGQEVPKESYDVLCNGNCTWEPCVPSTHTVPPFAVSAGITAAGEPLYVGM